MSGSQGGKGSEEGTPKKIKLRRTLQMGAESHFGEGHGGQSQSAQLALAPPASATGAALSNLAAVPAQAVPTPPEKSAAADPATSHDPTATAAVPPPPPPSAAVPQTALPVSPCKESWAWEYFDPAPGEAKTPRTKAVHVKCRICNKILSRGVRRSTTTSMLRHLRTMHEITGPATATSEPAKKKKKTGSSTTKHSGSSGTGSKVPPKPTSSKGGQKSSADASEPISSRERHMSNDFFPQVCNICHASVNGGSAYNSLERGDARVAHMRQYHASEWQKYLKKS